ncbi:DNA integrity scanning protein DisA nucleotide-binding domain protein [Candidatus Woesearchaeota archaeon]|nr:DNA integrity scanning protein DisA nucleotide-binding domain protein [Candidatus Woesearchaeota archaeon]
MEDIATLVEPSTLEFFTHLRATKLLYITQIKKEESTSAEDRYLDVEVNVFARSEIGYARQKFKQEIKKQPFGTLKTVKDLVFSAINKKLLDKGDKVLCLVDESVGIGYKGITFVFDIDSVLVHISRHHLSDKVAPTILEAIIDIATEIATEGREGKKVGTAFIIGDKTAILKYVKQLVLNPFLGYMESKIKVTDPTIRETIKEFAQLDGVFVLDTDGSIITSCAYLDVPTDGIELQGFGTKHLNCAAITKQTDSIAVVVSSTGTIRIFKEGKIVMKL